MSSGCPPSEMPDCVFTLKAHRCGFAYDMLDGALDERVHAVFQHLGDEGVRRAYDELAPCFLKGRLVRHAVGVL